jgi:uncharacterized protein (TIGR03437 family)
MAFRLFTLLALGVTVAFAANPTQPAISPNGIVNNASYLAPGFANGGIARGSLFAIFGNYLGPDTEVTATSFPLPTSDGLAGTRVHINTGTYSADIPVVYTSIHQVGAILPSNVPEGDATITLAYRTLTSNPALIHVVRSAFGMFTLNQGGTGQAIVQNFVSASQLPVNTIVSAAAPGQTGTLWGTGLGPVSSGDEAAGPVPGPLPYLDALYVGGQRANVRFAGRSACCAGIDQVDFDVPANVSGCYVPVAAVVNGVVSNIGTIAVSSSPECNDPLSFSAADLTTLENAHSLAVGSISVWNLSAPPSETATGSFLRYSTQGLTAVPVPLHSTAGSCYETETALDPGAQAVSYADPLNAGAVIRINSPAGLLALQNTSPGSYSFSEQPPGTFEGAYSFASAGGADVGALSGSFTVGAPVQWTNAATFTAGPVPIGQPLLFQWTPGAAGTFVKIAILATGATLQTSIVCNLPAASGSFTVPDYLARTIVQGTAAVSLGSFTVQHAFTASSGLDAGIVTAGANTTVQANFQLPPN